MGIVLVDTYRVVCVALLDNPMDPYETLTCPFRPKCFTFHLARFCNGCYGLPCRSLSFHLRTLAAWMQEPPARCAVLHLHLHRMRRDLRKLQTFELVIDHAITQCALCGIRPVCAHLQRGCKNRQPVAQCCICI